jgi:hypothetical protein
LTLFAGWCSSAFALASAARALAAAASRSHRSASRSASRADLAQDDLDLPALCPDFGIFPETVALSRICCCGGGPGSNGCTPEAAAGGGGPGSKGCSPEKAAGGGGWQLGLVAFATSSECADAKLLKRIAWYESLLSACMAMACLCCPSEGTGTAARYLEPRWLRTKTVGMFSPEAGPEFGLLACPGEFRFEAVNWSMISGLECADSNSRPSSRAGGGVGGGVS